MLIENVGCDENWGDGVSVGSGHDGRVPSGTLDEACAHLAKESHTAPRRGQCVMHFLLVFPLYYYHPGATPGTLSALPLHQKKKKEKELTVNYAIDRR